MAPPLPPPPPTTHTYTQKQVQTEKQKENIKLLNRYHVHRTSHMAFHLQPHTNKSLFYFSPVINVFPISLQHTFIIMHLLILFCVVNCS